MSSRANRRARRRSTSGEPKTRKLIDRDLEQRKFEELLTFNDERRVLAILDENKGMGKSLLLETMTYKCRSKKIPVCSFALDHLSDIAPYSVVQSLVQQLKRQGVEFPKFERVENARIFGDPSSIHNYFGIDGRVILDGADFTSAKNVTATGVHIDHQEIHLSQSELTEKQEKKALETGIEGFFADLRDYCVEKPIVILLDAYEKCCPEPEEEDEFIENWEILEDWIIEVFLKQLFFDLVQRPTQLILVLAGRRIPDFAEEFPLEHERVVSKIEALSPWEKHHVEECLQMIGLDYQPKDVDTFFHFIQEGLPILQIMNLMKSVKNQRERRASKDEQ